MQQALGVIDGGEQLEGAAVCAQEAQHALLQLLQTALSQHLLRSLRISCMPSISLFMLLSIALMICTRQLLPAKT